MQRIFIVNPKSGKGKSLEVIKYIETICKLKNYDYKIFYTEKKDDAKLIAEYFKNTYSLIYSVGGDGTVNEVSSGLAHGNSFMGIIPAGTGNDFYKTIKNKEEGLFDIDLGIVNDKYFINIASIGIDAEACVNADLMKKLKVPNCGVYTSSFIYTYLKYHNQNLKLNNIEKDITLLTVANGQYYGGGYKIAPDAKIDDGLLNIILAEDLSKLEIPGLLLKVANASHYKDKRVKHFKVQNLSVKAPCEIFCQLDGEVIKDNEFNFAIYKNAVRYYNYDDFDVKSKILKK